MILLTLYKNGFKITGHASPSTCGEVSIMSWSCVCSIERLDKTCRGYVGKTDAEKYGRDFREGVTQLTFDPLNAKAAFVYQEFAQNMRDWLAGGGWPEGEVRIERVKSKLEPLLPTKREDEKP